MAIAVESAYVQGLPILWGAPTFDQVRIAWDEMRGAAGEVAAFRESRMTAYFPTGGTVKFRSLDDPNNARGHTAAGIVVDEAQKVDERGWREVLRPMLIDTGGWAWLIGTPYGRNWFWRGHVAALDDPEAMAWQVPTLGVRLTQEGLVREPHPLENPDIPYSEILDLYRTSPERVFRQEILAEFIEDGGGVFRGVREAATATPQQERVGAVIQTWDMGPKQTWHQYVMGVDWGKSEDFTAISVIDLTTREEVHLDRFNRIDYVFQAKRLAATVARFRPTVIVAEANAMGAPLIDRLSRGDADAGIPPLPIQPFTTTNETKKQVVEALALAIENLELRILPDEVANDELRAFEVGRTPSGKLTYGAPPGLHDDTVIARCLAWYAADMGGVEYAPSPYA